MRPAADRLSAEDARHLPSVSYEQGKLDQRGAGRHRTGGADQNAAGYELYGDQVNGLQEKKLIIWNGACIMKRAIIYYSLSGNTKEAAEKIAKEIGADLFPIELVNPLPDSKAKQMLVGGMQATFGMQPKIQGVPEHICDYDEIILGTPIWAGKAASPVHTFVKQYGVADKVTAVFTFSGGGDNDACISKLSKSLYNLKHQTALADRNNEAASANDEKLETFITTILEEQ